MTRTRWDIVPDLLFLGGITLSYVTLYAFADHAQFPWAVAWTYPLVIDGFIAYGAHEADEAAHAGRKRAQRYAMGVVFLFTTLTGILQAVHGWNSVAVLPPGEQMIRPWMSAAAHAVPAVIIFFGFEMRLRRNARRREQAAEARAEARAELLPVPAELKAEVKAELLPELRGEVRKEVLAEVTEEFRAEVEELRAELTRNSDGSSSATVTRKSTRTEVRKTARKELATGPSKRDRAVEIVDARPGITAKELADEIEATPRYARDLLKSLNDEPIQVGG